MAMNPHKKDSQNVMQKYNQSNNRIGIVIIKLHSRILSFSQAMQIQQIKRPYVSAYRGAPTRGCTDPLQHLQRCKRQCGATVENDSLILKQFPLFLGGIAYDWYRTLHEITILTQATMEERFLRAADSPAQPEMIK